MQKLLFLLFFYPFIVFPQQINFDLDEKYKIYSLKNGQGGFSKYNDNGARYQGQLFTGGTSEINDNRYSQCYLNLDYTIGKFEDPEGASNDVLVAFEVWHLSDPFLNSKGQKTECMKVEYFANGREKYNVTYLDDDYKSVMEFYHFSSDNRKMNPKNYSVYYPNNKIAYYREYYEPEEYTFEDKQTKRIQLYYENGVLFSEFSFWPTENGQSQNLYRDCYKQEYFDSKGEWLQTIYLENKEIKTNSQREGRSVTGLTRSGASSQLSSFLDVDTYMPELFVEQFLFELEIIGMLFYETEFKEQEIDVSFKSINSSESEKRKFILALAYAKGNDDLIRIEIDPVNWENSSIVKKWYILYHELGHDVLNLKHGQGGKMMFNFADADYNWMDFLIDKRVMFKYYFEH